MSYTTVTHCGNEHATWVKNLDFYKDDLDILQKRMEEIARKNNGQEVMAQVEHFQNQFLLQQNNIHDLKHEVNVHANRVAADVKVHAGKMEVSLVSDHEQLKEKVGGLETVINGLREKFNEFLTKWM